MLAFADELRGRGAGLRVLNLGGGDVDTATPMGSMLFTIMAALAQMEHEIKRERVTDSISKAGKPERTWGADPAGSPRVRFAALSVWSKAVSPLGRLPAISECPA
ncbi:UNVERIFIED_ORG: DNA invertase Pin-like site-specific DNA recombinase [Arthrobacter sp. UYCu721]